MLQLTLQADNEIKRQLSVNCSITSAIFEDLMCGTNYSITASLILTDLPHCTLRRVYVTTESCGGIYITPQKLVHTIYSSVVLCL